LLPLVPGTHAALRCAVFRQDLVDGSLAKDLEQGLAVQLVAQLPGQLARPIGDAFRGAFQKQLLPAVEGAVQAMFTQVGA
jgi:hypothetical protein